MASLAAVLDPGGFCYLLCLSDQQDGGPPPRLISRDELRATFRDGWTLRSIEPDVFELIGPDAGIEAMRAWLAIIQRI